MEDCRLRVQQPPKFICTSHGNHCVENESGLKSCELAPASIQLPKPFSLREEFIAKSVRIPKFGTVREPTVAVLRNMG